MKRISFAYVVQLDLPGGPVKVGHSGQPRKRLASFAVATPVSVRMVGLTLDGKAREAEMMAATASAIIHGEWRYPTDELAALLKRYFDNGEWFTMAESHKEHFKRTNVTDRVKAFANSGYIVSPQSSEYHWASHVLKAAYHTDPLLGIDWSGFEPAASAPSLVWPTDLARAA